MRQRRERTDAERLAGRRSKNGRFGHPPPDAPPPEQQGDCYGEPQGPAANGEALPRQRITAADVATIDDLIRVGAQVRWLWPKWIQVGVLTAIAAPGGTGKTRFCGDLLRRIRHRLPWPDGAEMEAPADALALWVVADNHHDEMVTMSLDFGIKDSVRINAHRSDPFGGVALETAEDLGALDARIEAARPLLVVVDTVGNATDRNLSRQEDAKAFYFPLQVLARRHACAILALTHLNATGHFLGRRVLEKVRVAIRMDRPDPSTERRSLEVVKSNSKRPAPLGLTMGDNGNEYDNDPPKAPEGLEPGMQPRPTPAVDQCCDWLRAKLEQGPGRVAVLRDEAEGAGYSSKTLYAAKERLDLEEYQSQGRKWWRVGSHETPFE